MINFIYSYFILPSLVFLSHLVALFSKKIRKPLIQRYKIFSQLKNRLKELNDKNRKVVVIHSASMGEFEHIKPLISQIKEKFSVFVIVTFFSPSGYENVKSYPGVDLFLYLPFDFKNSWRKFYRAANVRLLIISKHDVWPNQIRIANELNIETILVNASLNENSSRNSYLARSILSLAYSSLNQIFAVSEQDGQQFQKSFRCENVQVSGDTKFDQVVKRKMESADKELISKKWLANSVILVLGSLWPQDAEHVLKNIRFLLDSFETLKVIIVPHQPTEEYISIFSGYFPNFRYALFSDEDIDPGIRIMIIDKIGVLADIYKYGDIAYVGGSFKQGIHNVMEPAVYGLPVLYGPVHKNSYEAKKLLKKEGSITINSAEDFISEMKSLLSDKTKCETIGKNAYDYVNKNSGGTKKILGYLEHILG